MTAVDFLLDMHKKLLRGLQELRTEDLIMATENLRFTANLLDDFEIHWKVEEGSVFPAFKTRLESITLVHQLIEDHKNYRETFAELRDIMKKFDADNKAITGRMTEIIFNFTKQSREHATKEEKELYIPAPRLLSESELRKADKLAMDILIKAGRKDLAVDLRKAIKW